MAFDKLGLYNAALRICSERSLGSLTEQRKPRRLLDAVWNEGGVRACLEAGQWTFASRTIEMQAADDIEPEFGYKYAFNKPDDYVQTMAISTDEYLNNTLTAYADEAGFLYTHTDKIYLKYISDDASYGSDMELWPQSFFDYCAAHFAKKIIGALTQSPAKKEEVKKEVKETLSNAQGKDGLKRPPVQMGQGTWVSARRGGNYGRDRTGRGIGNGN